MKKSVRFLTMVMALVVVCAAFAPAALADYAPTSWSSWPAQKYNDSNNLTTYVFAIQRFLRGHLPSDASSISFDGVYGSATATYVQKFQKLQGISQTGNVTSLTWARMKKNIEEYNPSTSGGVVMGVSSNDVSGPNVVTVYYYRVLTSAGKIGANQAFREYVGATARWRVTNLSATTEYNIGAY